MNLALLRVCTIVFFVNILGFIISMLFKAVHSGELASLWNALTTSSFEDLLGTGGLMIASGVFIPLVLGTLAVAALFALGIFTLVKKNVKTLKILAVMFLAWVVLSAIVINHTNAGNDIVNLIFNVNVVVAIAGMEGALASVIGGLTDKPVIAVPTSVGYGANLGGLSALLTMINSCANGIAVVNIDNGYGAGYMATQINRLAVLGRVKEE